MKFEKLVKNEIKRLSKNPTLGKMNFKNNYSITIYKQTTIFYRINDNAKSVELLLFWNNSKNPEDLNKLL